MNYYSQVAALKAEIKITQARMLATKGAMDKRSLKNDIKAMRYELEQREKGIKRTQQ